MTSTRGTMATTFPTERNGYSPSAVDAFVEEMGARLEEVQKELDDRVVRCAQAEQDMSKLKAAVSGYAEKEAAIAAVLVAVEQQRAAAGREIEAQLAKACEEADRAVGDGRLEAKAIVARAQADAEELMAEAKRNVAQAEVAARAACEAEDERLKELQAQYARTVAAMRTELSTLLAFLPSTDAAEVALRPLEAAVA